MEGGMKVVKFLVFCSNFIFWLCGIGLIVVGVLVQLAMNNTLHIKDVTASAAPILITAVGVIVFLVAFFGCCGAWRENNCMMTMFAILLCVIIIMEITAVILGYVYRGKVETMVQDSLADMIENYNSSTPEFRTYVDKLQMKMKCCGINSTADWGSFTTDGDSVPDSCCVRISQGCGMGTMHNATVVYQTGCKVAFIKLIQDNLLWVIVAAIIIAVLQVMGVCFACMLIKEIRSGYEVM